MEAIRPAGALPDWQPGAVVRLPFSKRNCSDGDTVGGQALMALADSAMVIACSAAWNGYRPMSTIDQTTHFLRPAMFDVVADARVVRIGRGTSFGRVMLLGAADKRPVGMVASAFRCCEKTDRALARSRTLGANRFSFVVRTSKLLPGGPVRGEEECVGICWP